VPGLAFATAVTPSTDSFSALAGVKRSRVRAGILICSPVAGLRPRRAASLRLRKIPIPARRIEPFLFQLANNEHIEFIEGLLGVFLSDANGLNQMLHNLRLRHPQTSQVHRPNGRMAVMANPYRLNGAVAGFNRRGRSAQGSAESYALSGLFRGALL